MMKMLAVLVTLLLCLPVIGAQEKTGEVKAEDVKSQPVELASDAKLLAELQKRKAELEKRLDKLDEELREAREDYIRTREALEERISVTTTEEVREDFEQELEAQKMTFNLKYTELEKDHGQVEEKLDEVRAKIAKLKKGAASAGEVLVEKIQYINRKLEKVQHRAEELATKKELSIRDLDQLQVELSTLMKTAADISTQLNQAYQE